MESFFVATDFLKDKNCNYQLYFTAKIDKSKKVYFENLIFIKIDTFEDVNITEEVLDYVCNVIIDLGVEKLSNLRVQHFNIKNVDGLDIKDLFVKHFNNFKNKK